MTTAWGDESVSQDGTKLSPSHDAASSRGRSEEMEGESGATMPLFEVRWLHFNDGVAFELVNAVIARVAAGWQPFATLQHPSGGWSLLLRRQAAP